LISSFPGIVYLTPDGNDGIFADSAECRLLAAVIDEVIAEPSMAGPTLDVTVLQELRRLLSEVKVPAIEDPSPVVLSQELAIYLELVIEQIIIQRALPVKFQFTCHVCGTNWRDDPDRLAQLEAGQKNARWSQIIADLVSVASLMEGGHKVLASIRAYGALSRSQPSSGIRCPECKTKPSCRYVTYCPRCHDLRAETVLLECPNCTYDFRSIPTERLWATADEALGQFKISYKQIAISEAVGRLHKYARPGQVNNLISDISPHEQLLGICRCAVVGGRSRDTIILFTSEKIVWTIQGLAGSERHAVPRNQVREIDDQANKLGVACIRLANGGVISFSNFIGTGIDLRESCTSAALSGAAKDRPDAAWASPVSGLAIECAQTIT
jgi:hypothetical protein